MISQWHWNARRALIWYWPDRRGVLLMPIVLVASMLGVLWTIRAQPAALTIDIALFVLEVGLPALIGMAMAGALASDSALDLLLCAPYPTRLLLLGRIAVPLFLGAVLGGLSQWLLALWKIPLAEVNPLAPLDLWERMLIWAAPMVFFSGVALAGSMLGGSLINGIQWLVGLLVVALVLLIALPSICPENPLERCHATLVYPLLTMMRPLDPDWMLNRLLLLGIGGGLLGAGGWLSRRSEHLIAARDSSVREN